MQPPDVEVLLGTYNGERFVREQIDSILKQDHADFRIIARDDGSQDGTVRVLEEYAARWPQQFRLLPDNEATGHPKRNFLRLMKASTAEYVCFSDQDDFWLPQKISLTMQAMDRLEKMHEHGTPLLVFTDLRVVDESLQPLHPSYWKRTGLRVENVHRLQRLLGQNVVTGCTAMINRSMCELALQMPEEAEMHDSWICLLSAVFGAAEAISQPTVLYRQHGNNAIGSPEPDTSLSGLALRVQVRRRALLKRERQAEALLRLHGRQMTAERRGVIEAYLRGGRSDSAWTRVGIALRYGFFYPRQLTSVTTILELCKSRSID
jgi:hypothetical protein